MNVKIGGLAAVCAAFFVGAVLVPILALRVVFAVVAGGLVLVLLAVLLVTVKEVARRLVAASFATAPLAVAVALHGTPWSVRLGLVVLAAAVALVAYGSGVLVWPDMAILFVVGVALVALYDAVNEKPKVEPPPALASFELPAGEVKAPATELRAPTKVDIVAVTPTPSGTATQAAMHFSALLLTRVPKAGPSGPVRVLVARGKGDSTAMALARHSIDSTQFFLLPSADCFFAPAERGLSHRQAETILETYGFSDHRAEDFAGSFAGPVDFLHVNPGKTLNRYFSDVNKAGSFLTDWTFRTSRGARLGLHLPKKNRATLVQTVRALKPTMTLRGRIKDAVGGARQFIVLRRECFDFGAGRRVLAKAPAKP
jgi:hypothetical protein